MLFQTHVLPPFATSTSQCHGASERYVCNWHWIYKTIAQYNLVKCLNVTKPDRPMLPDSGQFWPSSATVWHVYMEIAYWPWIWNENVFCQRSQEFEKYIHPFYRPLFFAIIFCCSKEIDLVVTPMTNVRGRGRTHGRGRWSGGQQVWH